MLHSSEYWQFFNFSEHLKNNNPDEHDEDEKADDENDGDGDENDGNKDENDSDGDQN